MHMSIFYPGWVQEVDRDGEFASEAESQNFDCSTLPKFSWFLTQIENNGGDLDHRMLANNVEIFQILNW